jgi:imidazolonepropionase-like amidohydrolase
MCKKLFILFFPIWQVVNGQVSFDHFAITGVTIIDADHPTALAHQTVLIYRNTIENVFPDGSQPIPDSFPILRMKGKYLLPGLIDAHVHVATDPSTTDNREHTLNTLKRMLFKGVTSVRDMAGDARTLAGLSRDALTGDMLSPDIYYAALMAGPDFFSDPRTAASTKGAAAGHSPYMLAVTDSTNLSAAIAAAKGTGATGIKLYANLSPRLAADIITEAHKQNMIVWGHAWLQQSNPSDLVKAGIDAISHAPLIIHEKLDSIPTAWKKQHHDEQFWNSIIPDFSELFNLMKGHRTILDATLLTYKQWAEEDPGMQYDYELAKRITARAYRSGVTIAAGTDDDQKEFVDKEIELLVKDAGFTAIDAIVAGTLNGAKVLHIDDKTGTVAKGKIADLALLDKNPLEKIDNIESVALVIKGGKIYKQ